MIKWACIKMQESFLAIVNFLQISWERFMLSKHDEGTAMIAQDSRRLLWCTRSCDSAPQIIG